MRLARDARGGARPGSSPPGHRSRLIDAAGGPRSRGTRERPGERLAASQRARPGAGSRLPPRARLVAIGSAAAATPARSASGRDHRREVAAGADAGTARRTGGVVSGAFGRTGARASKRVERGSRLRGVGSRRLARSRGVANPLARLPLASPVRGSSRKSEVIQVRADRPLPLGAM
jgi:hypothetical protein